MIHTIMSIVFFAVIIFFAFLLTALAVLMIANTGAARQERKERELPSQHPGGAGFKRGA